MKVVTDKGLLLCGHLTGKVSNKPSQLWVFVSDGLILIAKDPQERLIGSCSLPWPNNPCTRTHEVRKGYSDLFFIDGCGVVLDNLIGRTDGSGGTSSYHVASAGQDFVQEPR